MHATGRYDPPKFKQQYEFLSNLRHDELATLRGHFNRARKLLATSPAHLRAEREEEVKRLERAMKRAESAVNLDNQERVELKALQSAKQTEKEKRKQGKTEWWMKRCKPNILLRLALAFTYSAFVVDPYSRKEGASNQSPPRCHRIGWRQASGEEGHREEAKESWPKREEDAPISP